MAMHSPSSHTCWMIQVLSSNSLFFRDGSAVSLRQLLGLEVVQKLLFPSVSGRDDLDADAVDERSLLELRGAFSAVAREGDVDAVHALRGTCQLCSTPSGLVSSFC